MLSNQAKIESLLFISGNDGITVREIALLTGIMKPAVLEQLKLLEEKYAKDNNSSLKLIHADERYRLVTKKALATLVRQYFESPAMTELSGAALETLAIIAYRQPVTRLQIDEIRGVQSSGMLQKLLALDLVTEAGRLDAPGRPIMYKTTENFLNYFGIENLAQLPELPKQEEAPRENDADLMELFNDALTSEE
ncbi:SMC-Scp complex subunit ScpB [Ligilactobacillus faecis]|uniref:Segregation and condensation protein B n=1 Tax=Ligilactobacillus faecis TaxID=762833 RepID=A0ABV4DQG6_9LACO|nr:SMC-Scp complex subunit ScpB [Ligilactobacillus faecis]WGN89202.1 SMC-Scp complex subunit ScpB [Ligilactobacillus faecis]